MSVRLEGEVNVAPTIPVDSRPAQAHNRGEWHHRRGNTAMRIFVDEPFKWLMTYRAEAVLNSPLEKVFRHLTSTARQAEWLGGSASNTHLRLHSVFVVETEVTWQSGGTSITTVPFTVTECVPGERIAYECERYGSRVRHSFDVGEGASGTHIAYCRELVDFGLLGSLLSLPLVAGVIVSLPVSLPFILMLEWWVRRSARRKLRRIAGEAQP